MYNVRQEPRHRAKAGHFTQAVPGGRALGVRFHGHPGPVTENGIRKPLSSRDLRSVLKAHQNGAPAHYHRSSRLQSLLQRLGVSYGPPRYLLTDKGTQFNAKFFLEVCRELGIAKVFTTAYHPQTNGQVKIKSHYHQLSPRIRRTTTRKLGRVHGSHYLRVQLQDIFVPPLGALRAHPVQTPAKPVIVELPYGYRKHPNLLKGPLLGQDPGAGTLGATETSGVAVAVQEELRSKCEGEEQKRTTKPLDLPSPLSA
jgi:hypothetical protein